MNVSLTPELERFVQDKVQTGRYSSADEVIGEAVRLFWEREQVREMQRQELRNKIAEGAESLDRGEGTDGEGFLRELEAGLEELEQQRKKA